MKNILILTFLLVGLMARVSKAQTVPDSLEFQALKALYENTDGANWTNNTGWPTPGNWPVTATAEEMGEWFGVTVVNGDVVRVDLKSNNLTGQIPLSIGDLTEVNYLDLSYNNLTGVLPNEIGSMTKIITLLLGDNDFTGVLPTGFSNLLSLRYMAIARNSQLTGEIPTEWNQLSSLEQVFLFNNNIIGSLPSWITTSWPNLKVLNLNNNSISGEIPTDIGTLSNLENFALGKNQLSGQIPASLGDLPNLIILSLSENQLVGEIPSELGNITTLKNLFLGTNQFTGEIPSSIGNLASLTYLDLHNNQLTGTIPSEFSSLINLYSLDLGLNQLTGGLPEFVGTFSNLSSLNLKINQLSGNVPVSLAGMNSLTLIWLHGNNFTSFPDFTTNSSAANIKVNIDNNYIPQADIDANIGLFSSYTHTPQKAINGNVADEVEFQALKALYESTDGANWTNNTGWPTSGNWPTSATAEEMGEWFGVKDANGDIYLVSLANNNLAGELPASIGSLAAVTNLILTANQISGSIPASLANLTKVAYLRLNNNDLSGSLPTFLGSLTNLRQLWLEGNEFTGYIPMELSNLIKIGSVRLNNNLLTGSVPLSFTPEKWPKISQLYLHNNQLSGPYPVHLDNLITLKYFNISGNSFDIGLTPDAPEIQALKDLYEGTDGANWTNNTGWPSDQVGWDSITSVNQATNWYGLSVSNGDVKTISLKNNNLVGELHSSVGDLVELGQLILTSNQISGGIPSSLGNLTKVYYLRINNNNLSGTLPPSLASLANVRQFWFEGNNLEGSIPSELANLDKVSSIRLNSNKLSGDITGLFNGDDFPKLIQLYIHGNQLTGDCSSIFSISSMNFLQIQGNSFDPLPSFPEGIISMLNLKYLVLAGLKIDGAIPNAFLNMPSLYYLNLSNNNFTSSPNFSNHPNISNLSIWINNNKLPYADIEANFTTGVSHNFKKFTYADQGASSPTYPTTAIIDGTQLVIDTRNASTHNTFIWEKEVEGVWVPITTENEHSSGDIYVRNSVAVEDAGLYRYTVTSSLLGETATSEEFRINTVAAKHYFLDQWAFQYKYDGRKRMVEKQVPGAGAVYMVYDDRDRLVLTQDANQRVENKWLFTKYDAFNRPVTTGVYTDAIHLTRDDMQAEVNAYYEILIANEQAWYESVSTESGNIHNYENKSFPQTPIGTDYLTVTYYDNYTVSDTWGMGYVNAQLTQTTNAIYSTDAAHNAKVKGQVTASMVKNLDDNSWLKTVSYYDNKYRVIQTVAGNHLQGVDRASSLYDFVGKALQTVSIHENSVDTYTTLHTNSYDHAGRLMEVRQELDNDPATELLLVSNDYNELGELIEKNIHSEDAGTTFAQSIDYRYNIRGWLTHINDATLNDGENDYFGMELAYNTGFANITSTDMFNGNISAIKWSSGVVGSQKQAYAFEYDPMNRLTSAGSKKTTLGVWADGTNDVSVGNYDLNGNINSLTRDSFVGTMDNLIYDYGTGLDRSNQLQLVSENGGNLTEGFKDGANSGNDYDYDANGNMTEDKNKDINQIEYNHLNLPSKVTKSDGQYIKYIYDATGIKLAQEVYDGINPDPTKRTDYSGAYIYEKNGTEEPVLQFIQTSEGRILIAEGSSEYQYHLKDHLGNIRVTFTTNENVDSYLATMETEYDEYEEATFSNIFETRKDDFVFNHTDANPPELDFPIHSAILNNDDPRGEVFDRAVGPAKSLRVAPGDVIDLEVYAKYIGYNGNGSRAVGNTIITAIVSGITPVGVATEVITQLESQLTTAGVGALDDDPNTDSPLAYLTYILFDNNFQPIITIAGDVDAGFDQVTTDADGAFEKLEIPIPIEITQAGYMYIYVSNEDAANVNVHFDDLKITHTKSKIVQMDDYYPFGLAFNSFKREDNLTNKFKYNGFEEQSELDWNVYDYQARYYDPALGRFLNVDPAADLMRRHSPYNYAFDNPIRFIDPDGMIPEDMVDCCGGSPQSIFNEAMGKLENLIMPVVDAVVSAVDAGLDAITPEKIEVTEAAPEKKSFENGNDRTVYEDPDAPAGKDNAPNQDGSAKVIVEPDVIFEVDESMNQSEGGSGILDLIFDVKPFKLIPSGDSVLVEDYYNPGVGMIMPAYKNGRGELRVGIGGRRATKKDSVKYDK